MARRRRTPSKSTTLTNCFETSFFPRSARSRTLLASTFIARRHLSAICQPRFPSIIPRFVAEEKFSRERGGTDFGCAIRLRTSYYSLDSILFRGNTWNYTRQGWTYPAPGLHEIRSNDVSRPSRYICINCLERGGVEKSNNSFEAGKARAHGGLRCLMRDIS